MKKRTNSIYLFSGIFILVFLGISYFINIDIETGANYLTQSSLLGYIIFYNPFILGIYILIAIYLMFLGKKKGKGYK